VSKKLVSKKRESQEKSASKLQSKKSETDSAENSITESAPAVHENRVAIIGCGNVGMTSAFALLQSQLVRELVLIDADMDKAEGETMDLQQAIAVPMTSPVKVDGGQLQRRCGEFDRRHHGGRSLVRSECFAA
jgi:hypothetical protein